ncbi:MAG: 16S rRNA (cytosine(1402)-N(4))-methyltransferase RsmH [bacterium]|nr:16S rRNA (cytosine(1402)-N(4))-methyltransferase RsmH [bacterium]
MTHIPVLLKEVLEALNPKPGDFIIDGTVGEGGHAKEIVRKIGSGGIFLGVDWDGSQVERAKKNLESKNVKVVITQGNYREIPDIQKKRNLPKADGLLLDLGFSSNHLWSGRGFSFEKDEPLDMRYDADNDNDKMTAADVINSFSEQNLANLLWKYGEERASRKIAKAIVEARKKEKILTTGQLVKIIEKVVSHSHSHSHSHRPSIHPATKVFQALRIYVNDELGNLENILGSIAEIMRPGGRIVIISFHSLEDRMVKQAFKKLEEEGKARRINKKVIKPSWEEIQKNPRSRSAKLRVVEILNPKS